MTILSCLGAVAEASIAIATGLFEIEAHNPTITRAKLRSEGLLIGKEIIGTAFNTLFFGFYGELLALFIWFSRLNYSFGMIINDKIFISEFFMTLISSIGVILTIPVTIGIFLRHKKTTI